MTNSTKEVLVFITTIIVVLLIGIGSSVYKYHDCRKVGHSKLYCIMNFGK